MDRELEHNEIREKLDRLARDLTPEEFALHLPDKIALVAPAFPDVSCEQYSIGTSRFRHSILALYPKLDSLKADDLALYYCCEEVGVSHVGRVQEDGLVISKWGNSGPVLRHPVDMVPASYGYYVFFREGSAKRYR